MKRAASLIMFIVPFLLVSGMGHADSLLQYEVTITNLTKGQPFSPTVVILHDPQMEPIFTLGEPSSVGIWSIAETGNTAPLVAALTGNPHIYDMQVTDGPFLPGTSVTVVLDGGYVLSGQERKLSLAGMLGKTNDSFFALNGVPVPTSIPPYKQVSTQVFMANGYDSGTEVNNELCDYVGGCGQGLRLTDGAEGYVYVSSGYHGVGDLDASMLDWKNPVAEIRVRALPPSL